MPTNQLKHILIAPLDWGLGHTARCVPIIRHLQDQGWVPVVACNEWQRSFLNDTLGNIETVHLEGYNIRYSARNRWMQAGLLWQLPGIVKTIKAEHKWLQGLLQERQIDGIISDNRYGLYSAKVPSVIMTHQLRVQSGMGQMADDVAQRLHYRYLEKFDNIWVPDVAETGGLAGVLSHPRQMPANTSYMGLLSRFDAAPASVQTHKIGERPELLVLLSGAEPQRTAIAELLWQQAMQYKGIVTFVEGTTEVPEPKEIPPHISYHKRLTGTKQETALHQAELVVCRSGYSTLMDLVAQNKRAIVIPTPEQTEQEYLGAYLHEQGIFYCAPPKGL